MFDTKVLEKTREAAEKRKQDLIELKRRLVIALRLNQTHSLLCHLLCPTHTELMN